MKSLWNLVRRFFADDKAAEVTELGIVLALVVAGAVIYLSPIGNAVVSGYSVVNANL